MLLDFSADKSHATLQIVYAGRRMVNSGQVQMTLAANAPVFVAVLLFAHIHNGGDTAVQQAIISFAVVLPSDMQMRRDFAQLPPRHAFCAPMQIVFNPQAYGIRTDSMNLTIRFRKGGGWYLLRMPTF